MDWKWLYTSTEGRISRKQFWLGAVILFAVMLVISVVLAPLSMMSPMLAGWIGLVVFLVFAWPGYTLSLKRSHDRNQGNLIILISMGLGVLSSLIQAFGLGYTMTDIGGTMVPMPSLISTIIGVASALVGLYLLVVLGVLKGTDGDNQYGPDPLASAGAD